MRLPAGVAALPSPSWRCLPGSRFSRLCVSSLPALCSLPTPVTVGGRGQRASSARVPHGVARWAAGKCPESDGLAAYLRCRGGRASPRSPRSCPGVNKQRFSQVFAFPRDLLTQVLRRLGKVRTSVQSPALCSQEGSGMNRGVGRTQSRHLGPVQQGLCTPPLVADGPLCDRRPQANANGRGGCPRGGSLARGGLRVAGGVRDPEPCLPLSASFLELSLILA